MSKEASSKLSHLGAQKTFSPPPGGDVRLRSSDGVEFQVHSVLLSMVSSVFRDMFTVGTEKDTIDLAEDAQAISLMLEFIYPIKKAPTISDFDTLVSCLSAAQKYELEGILETVDAQLSNDFLIPSSFVRADPLRLHRLGLEFNLPEARANAARRISGGGHDLLEPTRLAKFARAYPSCAGVVALVGIQGTRSKILAEVFFGFDEPHMRLLSGTMEYFDLSCLSCQKHLEKTGNLRDCPPSWVIHWSRVTYKALVAAPLEECLRFFDASIFDKIAGSDAVCGTCLDDFSTSLAQRETFNQWAGIVKTVLETRLASLEPLYSLV